MRSCLIFGVKASPSIWDAKFWISSTRLSPTAPWST